MSSHKNPETTTKPQTLASMRGPGEMDSLTGVWFNLGVLCADSREAEISPHF
jgi:hypothetical protein